MKANDEEIGSLCQQIRDQTDAILDTWQEVVSETSWVELPREYRIDHLPAVIGRLMDLCVSAPDDLGKQLEAARAAAKHGEDRRAQDQSETLLFREYHLLRQTLWRYLQNLDVPANLRVQAISRIDAGISLTTAASLRGYYRDEIGDEDAFNHALNDLVHGGPLSVDGEREPPDGGPASVGE